MNRAILLLSLLLLSIGLWACLPDQQDPDPYRYHENLKRRMEVLQLTPSDIYVSIDKSEYRLSIMSDTLFVKSYPVVFGGNAVDDKMRQGDSSTPEGEFKVKELYPHKKWSKFIWIDYPTEDSWRKHRGAKKAGLIPQNAAIGGDIGIHGIPIGYDESVEYRQNWTLGCISMRNDDVDEIYPFLEKGSRIFIQK